MRRTVLSTLVVLAAAGVIAWLPSRLSDYHQLEGAGVATFFVAILGLNILTGYTGQLSIGHGAFMAIGGYTTAILLVQHHWSSDISTIPLAALVAFGVGIVVGIPALRLSGAYLALATFAVALVVPALALKYSGFTGGRAGLNLPDFHSGHWLYVTSWIVAAIAFAIAWAVLRGRTGRSFRAVRDSPVAAASSGISLAVYKTVAFGISAGFAGAAGALFVIANAYAQPDEFGLLLSIELLIGAAVGGLGSLWGLLVGALFVEWLRLGGHVPGLGFTSSTQAPEVIQGLAVILIMFLLPGGFAGLLRRIVAPLTNRSSETS